MYGICIFFIIVLSISLPLPSLARLIVPQNSRKFLLWEIIISYVRTTSYTYPNLEAHPLKGSGGFGDHSNLSFNLPPINNLELVPDPAGKYKQCCTFSTKVRGKGSFSALLMAGSFPTFQLGTHSTCMSAMWYLDLTVISELEWNEWMRLLWWDEGEFQVKYRNLFYQVLFL